MHLSHVVVFIIAGVLKFYAKVSKFFGLAKKNALRLPLPCVNHNARFVLYGFRRCHRFCRYHRCQRFFMERFDND